MKKLLGVSFLGFSMVAFAGQGPHSANCNKVPMSAPCMQICTACQGFPVGDYKIGKGFYADCVGPIQKNGGTRLPKNDSQALPAAPNGATWAQIGQQCMSTGGVPKGL